MNRVFMKAGLWVLVCVMTVGSVALAFPTILKLSIQYEQRKALSTMSEQFPVTVNPLNKSIVENAQVNAYLESADSPYQAAIGNAGSIFGSIFEWIAIGIADAPWYQSIAAANGRFINVTPGMRREQVANAFASTLAWNARQKKEFLTASSSSSLPLLEGVFAPGVYFITADTAPSAVRALVNSQFYEDIVSHYGTTTAQVVPLNQALTIASLIEREAGGPDDMRLISGIIWNRLFINMNLQIDATLQYAKANTAAAQSWWPRVIPADRFRASPYNTYMHPGLPPAPIANPSVAAVLAALNPRNTSCLFYFHDSARQFHCTDTYAEHVALLKKYFGRGK